MPEGYAIQAIQAVLSGQRAYCKFLAANDTGLTGGHQAGIYISKPSIPILFDEPGIKGTNKEKWVKVKWQDGIETDTRFIYYGKGTRNEYRITNFGRGFPFLRPEYTGALFVFTKCDAEDYQAFVLNSEEDIDQFLDAFGISPTETNQLIDAGRVQEETQERIAIQEFIAGLTVDFPLSEEMSAAARDIQNRVYDHLEFIRTNPDRKIIDWTNTEYALFRAIEHARYGDAIARGFTSVDEFITMANMVLNRRKSRAGKSLEHHLSAIFAPIPDLPDRKTICIMERGNEKCQPKNENTQRRRVTMRPSRRGQCGWSPSRGGPAGRWPRNSASASTRCAAG